MATVKKRRIEIEPETLVNVIVTGAETETETETEIGTTACNPADCDSDCDCGLDDSSVVDCERDVGWVYVDDVGNAHHNAGCDSEFDSDSDSDSDSESDSDSGSDCGADYEGTGNGVRVSQVDDCPSQVDGRPVAQVNQAVESDRATGLSMSGYVPHARHECWCCSDDHVPHAHDLPCLLAAPLLGQQQQTTTTTTKLM